MLGASFESGNTQAVWTFKPFDKAERHPHATSQCRTLDCFTANQSCYNIA